MQTFEVNNIKCASCVDHIEHELSRFDKDVRVNFATKSVSLDISNEQIKDVVSTLSNIGYGVKSDEQDGINNPKSILIKVAILAFVIFYVSMADMFFSSLLPELLRGEENPLINSSLQLLLTIPIIIMTSSIYVSGFKNLFSGYPSMYSLIALGTSFAFFYSLFGFYNIAIGNTQYAQNLYFETVAVIVSLVLFGAYMEDKMRKKTSLALEKLLNLKPKTALFSLGDKEIQVPVEKLVVGDIVVVKAGMSIPVDGEIVDGRSVIDESMITGESIGVEKSTGDKVISSSINKNGVLKIRVEKLDKDNTINQIIDMVQQAQSQKSKMSKIADIFSKYFVWAIISIAILAFFIWFVILNASFSFSIYILVAILIIACPCAIGLATPVSIMVALSYATKKHILIKNVQSLEAMSNINAIALDKTGTITKGSPSVVDIKKLSNQDIDILSLSSSLADKSTHPLSQAIIKKVNNKKLLVVKDFEEIEGMGIKGAIENKIYYLGNSKLFSSNNISIPDDIYRNGVSSILFGDSEELLAILYIQDEIKNSSKTAIEQMQKAGIEVYMLSGDDKKIALNIANSVNIKEENVFANIMPQEKAKIIKEISKDNKKIAFVGDGINDSVALSTSDVGFAIGAGSDIAIESSDIVLTRSTLLDVMNAIDIGKYTIANIKQNLFFAVIYNCIGVIIASGMLYSSFNILLSPMIGALAMSLSSISVLSNALRLKTKLDKI